MWSWLKLLTPQFFRDALVFAGLALTTAGLFGYDWRIGVIWLGLLLLVAGLVGTFTDGR